MDKLLDCPFCGGLSQEVVSNDVAVFCCMSCFATASPEQWNTRHTPEGWTLVPDQPTDEMADAAFEADSVPVNYDHWIAMLAAAPKWGGE